MDFPRSRAMPASSNGSMPDNSRHPGVKRALCRHWASKVSRASHYICHNWSSPCRATVTWATAASLPTGSQNWATAPPALQPTTRLRCAKHSCLGGLVELGRLVTTHMALGSSGICSGQGWGLDMDIVMDRVINRVINMAKQVVVDGQQQMPKLFSVRTGLRLALVLTEIVVTLLMERDRSGA